MPAANSCVSPGSWRASALKRTQGTHEHLLVRQGLYSKMLSSDAGGGRPSLVSVDAMYGTTQSEQDMGVPKSDPTCKQKGQQGGDDESVLSGPPPAHADMLGIWAWAWRQARPDALHLTLACMGSLCIAALWPTACVLFARAVEAIFSVRPCRWIVSPVQVQRCWSADVGSRRTLA
jgi:hypothetical protein